MSLEILEDLFSAFDDISGRRTSTTKLATAVGATASPPLPRSPQNPDTTTRPDFGSSSLSSWGGLAAALRRRELTAARSRRAGFSPAAGQQRSSTPDRPAERLRPSLRQPSGFGSGGDALAPERQPDPVDSIPMDPRLPGCVCAICQPSAPAASNTTREAAASSVTPLRPLPFRPPPSPATPREPGATTLSANVVEALNIRDSDVFLLETNPGADKTIYLNFVGANLTGTGWDTRSWDGVSPAFSLDSDTQNFSSLELAAIKEIFARVACDYAPFDVNITTKPPSSDQIARTSISDTIYGTSCLFSNISRQTGYSSAGGVAYMGVFADVNNEFNKPALVFPNKLSNSPKNIAEAASHEIGHTLGLSHDGARRTVYYAGQGTAPGWAPIMGVGYYKDLVQFSRGTYTDANNKQNDLGIILSNGFGYWSDSVGNTIATATSLAPFADSDGDGISDQLRQGGAIEIPSSDGLGTPDRDVFSFVAPSDGSININIKNALLYYDPASGSNIYAPVPRGYGNLRLDAQLSKSDGTVLCDWNNDSELDVNNFNVSGLQADQTYFISVFSNPNSPDGEDTYASLGHYSMDAVYRSQSMSLPGITLRLPVSSVTEDSGVPLTFTFERSGDISKPLTCFYRLSGTAAAGVDYRGAPAGRNTVVFAANSAQATVVINPIADTTIETDETVSLTLLNDSTYSVESFTPINGTISNDDIITYTLNAPTSVCESRTVTVAISTRCVTPGSTLTWRISGEGISTADFTPASLNGTVRLDKSGRASVSFLIAADQNSEPTETMVFSLFDSSRQQVASCSLDIINLQQLWGSTANDTLIGQDQVAELISGVVSSGTQTSQLGTGQVDIVTGGSGPDLFQLSQMRSRRLQMFYNDGNNRTTGSSDYMQIQDFNPAEDVLTFAGGTYFTNPNGSDTEVWWDRNSNGALITADNTNATDELIAVLKNVQLGSNTITSTSTLAWVNYA